MLGLVFLGVPAVGLASDVRPGVRAPAEERLEAGDLVWAKVPGALVPYTSSSQDDVAERWLQERDRHLEELERKGRLTAAENERHAALKKMSYQGFVAQYLDVQAPGRPVDLGRSRLYVGHVGIIDIEDCQPFVIEAVMEKGVRRIPYAEWLAERPGELVWLGRLKDKSPAERAAVAEVATKQIGQPYDFWNFDLKDNSGFYCSKLAWFAISEAVGQPPDGDPRSDRSLWYSPRQLMRSPLIEIVHNPGDYASR